MNPARFQTIEEIFLAALDQEPDQVNAFLDTACEGDAVLRREVEVLLASDQQADRFIETSSVGLTTKVIQNQQADSLVGRTIGHYKISESIGTGGMGEVYLAADITAGRKAALKLLPLRFTGDAERLKRFQREERAVVGLNHPNIVTVYEIGEDHSIHYIASELIEGETLRQRLMRGQIQVGEAVDVAIQVANALVAAHETGIVHRDIKPENIMLRPDGYVKVLDFGIAKLAEQQVPLTTPRDEALLLVETNLGSILGTVRYMSPEQACGGHVDKRTDIWSLGVVLYEMLTGHAPFTGDTPQDVMSSILEKEPPPLTRYIARAPAELQQIINKTLRKDRGQRYDSANELLQALKDLRRKLEAELERATAPLWLRWIRSPAALVLVLTIATLALALPFYRHRNLATSLPADKSIAVLPFENLSDEKEHAAFADGVQDDILTKLAKIADLKVISQTSVRDYRGKRNLRQVGNDLGVSYVLEGSVRRSSTHLRLNAQLIDTRTDTHVWAQQYDRDLDDLFAIQSEIAQKVAERLNAKVTSAERLAIEEKPTTDLTAFELYSRAGDVLTADTLKAIDLLNQAVARDPSFLKAYCLLVVAHDGLYAFFDHTPARLALAEAALQEAFRIRPNAGEAHWARAFHLYKGYRDYDGALAELEVARLSLPNDSRIFSVTGYIQRRQGRWEESTRNLERAIELDPRDARILTQTGFSYGMFRRYAEQKSKLDRALSVAPNDVLIKADRAFVEVDWKADTGPLHQVIDEIRATNPAAVPQVADRWLLCTLAERDVTAAKDAFLASEFPLGDENVQFPRPFVEGVIARMAKDEHKAQLAFTAAREKQEKTAKAQPDYAPGWCVLGLIDAALGRKEEALREGRRAVELLPVEKDSINGLVMIKYLAMSAAWVGETDLAFEQLATAVRYPSGLELSYGELKLMPWWDPLRGDPRFEKILEESKNPVTLTTTLPPQKSIAVLPFENLTRDPDDAYFAEGIQEEILTRLAKVADLKVISRTSTQRYQSKAGNLSEIAKQLGVANILEGSVQKAADQVRVNVQLVNAETDSHLWADSYDRKLTDIFGVESEIAKGIAESLQAKLTGREEQALAVKPTNNPEAYDAYLRGLAFEGRSSSSYGSYNPYLVGQAAGFFERAVQLDPNFALAWARLSHMNAHLYFSGGLQSTSAQRDTAKRALDNAQKLEPNSPETLLALGYYQYYVLGDYGLATSTFRLVNKMLPSSSEVPYALGRVTRREGNWDESVTYFEQALTLEPRNVELLMELAETYGNVRQFPAALKLYDRVLDIKPNDLIVMAEKASIYQAQGNLPEAATFLSEINEQTHDELTFDTKISQLRLERNYGEAVRLLQARLAQFHFDSQDEKAVHQVALAFTQRLAGDTADAKATAEQSRDILEGLYRDESRSPKARAHYAANLSQAYAAMGEKDSALKTAAHAIMLWPRAKDPKVGPAFEENLVLIETIFGENSRAISTLARLLETPYGDLYNGRPVTPALLRLDPVWDPLRSDPAFQKLCEENAPLPEKSIAVLPFENLSKDEENAFFASGVQDEILTDLAKVADLKVISRTSVMKYKSDSERNLREIAKALGVSYVVEGSVQRAGERVRVSAQLIDARNDTHLWAEHYDRDFADIFAVQNEIAQQIAEQLKANLSPAEKAAIAERPTADLVAYAYYTKAKEINIYDNWEGGEQSGKQKVELLEKATQHDPNFALAYCELAKAQVDVDNFELAKKAAEAALRVRPDLGEAHLELARYYYYANLHTSNFDQALDELAIARRTLPNNCEAIMIGARIDKRQNRWDASLAGFQKASELDPRNSEVGWRLGQTYFQMRRYKEWEQLLMKDAGSGLLRDPWTQLLLTEIKLAQGDPAAAQSLLEQVPLDFSPTEQIWRTRFMAALYLRDYDAANRVIAATPAKYADGAFRGPSHWAEGQIARARGDKQKALAAFAAAREKMEAQQGDKPKDEEYFDRVAMVDAGLGRKEDAIREARRAVELMPIAKDSQWGPPQVADLALVYAWTGERDRALEQLEIVATIPGDARPTYGDLRFNPCWDSLRGDKRFDKIVAAAKAASR